MAAYINCRIWWCKDWGWFNCKWKLGHISFLLHSLTSNRPLFSGHNGYISYDVIKIRLRNWRSDDLIQRRDRSQCFIYSACTGDANVCAPCVKTSSHFYFQSMTHSSLDSSLLGPCFSYNDLTAAGEISWVEDYYKRRLPSIVGASFPLHHVVFLLVFQCSLVGNHLVSENVLHLCWPSRSN